MPIDFSLLAPAPWTASESYHQIHDADGEPVLVAEDGGGMDPIARDFTVLARNAFDVMMRRGWCPKFGMGIAGKDGWCVPTSNGGYVGPWSDPFTALVEADAWYKQNVEAAPRRQSNG